MSSSRKSLLLILLIAGSIGAEECNWLTLEFDRPLCEDLMPRIASVCNEWRKEAREILSRIDDDEIRKEVTSAMHVYRNGYSMNLVCECCVKSCTNNTIRGFCPYWIGKNNFVVRNL
ncbi:hypothetical protein HELRODRAFT_180010 [Helobdella robusta]|uniref:Insulin-like domain-containing protein n=1 Tax=Helobdella robusta TaxID=6412 RepID=T1FFC5_HELRO|nr:hypothetical protein HELRODRAFT_180010 [Helobdella robusta]ESN94905.1 hypothetical protein HELRODRAFT_180010 [Helobdella robusta]